MKMFSMVLLAYVLTTLLSPIVFFWNTVRKLWLSHNLNEYFKTVAFGFDQAGGGVIYSQENFTVSSYTYYLCRTKQNKYACWFKEVIDFLFGERHCFESYMNEIVRDKQAYTKFTEKVNNVQTSS